MSARPRTRLALAALSAFVALVSCDTMTRVVGTIPPNGATGVDPRTIVAVKINNSILPTDTSALEPRNFVVTGDLTGGRYQGSLVLAPSSSLRPGLTADEFAQARAGAEEKMDAIVFLLPSGASFKRGEWIRVYVSDRIKAHGTMLRDSVDFSFQIAEVSEPEGALKVVATDPAPHSLGVPLSPEIRASFSRGAKADTLASGIRVRGSQSGLHAGGLTAATRTDAEGAVEALRRLGAGDAFLPGETVAVAYASSIVAGSSASGSSPLSLVPYLSVFQAASGKVAGGWGPFDLGVSVEAPAAVLAADFRKDRPGAELAVVGGSSIQYFELGSGAVAARSETAIALSDPKDPSKGPFAVADAVACDLKGDGSAMVVVLLRGSQGSRLAFFDAISTGGFAASAPSVDFPAAGAERMLLADLDADGDPELLVTHRAGSAGGLALFEIRSVAPDPATIDLSDPASLQPKPRFQPVETTLSKAGFAERVEAADLDADGMLDAILETRSGIVFERRISSSGSDPWLYRAAAGRLLGRDGSSLVPLAWTVADADSDGDADVIAWDSDGALLYRNPVLGFRPSGVPEGFSLLAGPVRPEELDGAGLPAGIAKRAEVCALDADGDGAFDLLFAPSDGEAALYLQTQADPLAFEAEPLPAPGSLGPFAVADLDGDSGLDVASVPAASSGPRVFFSSGVEPPLEEEASSFSFASEASGLSDFRGATIRVAVVGDIAKTFSGYAIALDYDETALQYLGFEIPSVFSRKASFTLCPDAKLQGCAGYASARMAYLQNAKGVSSSGLLLGTFLFERRTVTEPVTARIRLASFSGTNGTAYENVVTVADGQATYEEAVDVSAGTVDIEVEPPAPPDLAASCAVLERGDRVLRALVSWESPSGVVFERFEVSAPGAGTAVLSGSRYSHELSTEAAGKFAVRVKGVTTTGREAEARCELVGIHRPLVTCEALSRSENVVRWTLSHAAESFLVYRNGVYLATKDAAATQHVDTSPPQGASNYQVAAVTAGVEGPRGVCIGGPVGDPDPEETQPPSNVQASLVARTGASSPNELLLRWTNGEGYDQVQVSVVDEFAGQTVASVALAGTDAQYRFSGDIGRGGVPPGRYSFQVSGSVRGVASRAVASGAVKVPVPELAVRLSCGLSEAGDIEVSWAPVWQGYTSFDLVVERLAGGVPDGEPLVVPVSLKDVAASIGGLAPSGSYRVKLVAGYGGPLPPDIPLDPSALERACEGEITYASGIFVEAVETGVGVEEFSIPVFARAHRPISGFSFDLELPSFLALDPETALRVEAAGVPSVTFEIADGSEPGRKKAVVRVEGVSIPADANGDGVVDEKDEPLLARIVAAVPADFGLPPESPLVFSGDASIRFGEGDLVPAPTTGAKLLLRRRFARLDEKTVEPGTQEPIQLSVRVTFNAPAGAPNYRMNAFQLHIVWDTSRLELLPLAESDQEDTAIAGLGWLILPTEETFPTFRASGHLKVSWLGFKLTNPTQPDYLYPGVSQKVLNVKFRSLVPAGSGAAFSAVSFVTDPKDQLPTAFFPEVDVPSEPDMEGFFPGGVRWTPSGGGFSVRSIRPQKGAHAGGAEAVLSGSGLVASGSGTSGVSIWFRVQREGDQPLEVPVETILSADPFSIRFRVPPSGIARPEKLSTLADVQVLTPLGTATLARAYSYEYPRVSGADLSSIRASGGELMVIRGEGLAILSAVAFRVEGAEPVPAEVAGVESDGTRIFALTPSLRGKEGKRASVEVAVPGFATLVVPGSVEIRADGTGPALRIDSVSPAEGTICGGDVVTIVGDGFLPGIVVRFGSLESPNVQLESGSALRATTPRVPEGTSRVDVTVANPSGASAAKLGAFSFLPAGAAFIRGDVTGDGKVNVEDAVALSALVLGKAGSSVPPNLDAADANDDGLLNGGDAIYLMNHLFRGGAAPPPPYPGAGWDPTPDQIVSCP
ncbi:MAG: IPT/TIG domain-containing protein [Planctomycetota bacterium]